MSRNGLVARESCCCWRKVRHDTELRLQTGWQGAALAQDPCCGRGVLEWGVNHREEKCSECDRNDGIPDYREHEVRAG